MKEKANITLEDRLRLMGIRETSLEKTKSPNSGDREKARLQRHGLGIHVHEDEPEDKRVSAEFTFSRISRESILKKVRSRILDHDDRLEDLASSPPPYDLETLDPDVPLPSREGSHEGVIKEESSIVDMYSIPYHEADEDTERQGSVIHNPALRDSMSEYSIHNSVHQMSQGSFEDDPPTPRAETAIRTGTPQYDNDGNHTNLGLPDLSSFLGSNVDFQSGFKSYLDSSSDALEKKNVNEPKEPTMMNQVHDYLARSITPEQPIETEEPSNSRVCHPPARCIRLLHRRGVRGPRAHCHRQSTRHGTQVRPSATPADFATMAATRRQVSGSMAAPPPVPEKSPKRLSFTNAAEANIDTSDKDVDRAVAATQEASRVLQAQA